MNDVLSEELEGPILRVTLRRPERRNALDKKLTQALAGALESLPRRPEVRVVILTGSGGSFCAGADLKGDALPRSVEEAARRIDELHSCIRGIVAAPQPVIAAVDGAAVGFGADLALACDFRLLSSTAYLQESFIQLGLMPDGGGSQWLPKLVGTATALRLLMLGERVSANQALEWGLAYAISSSEQELSKQSQELANDLAHRAPLALASIKRALRPIADVERTLAMERDQQLKLLASRDFAEGVAAWAEKRAPNFEGR